MKANKILFAVVILAGLLAVVVLLGGWSFFVVGAAVALVVNSQDSRTAGTPDGSRG